MIAIVMFGPERIPDMARKGARVIHFLRNIANQATSQLKEELGPEYAHLTAADLNPKTFIQKHLLDDLQDDIKEIQQDLAEIKGDLETESAELKTFQKDVDDAMRDDEPALAAVAAAPVRKVAFDDEAT